jgi:hypothetical protein
MKCFVQARHAVRSDLEENWGALENGGGWFAVACIVVAWAPAMPAVFFVRISFAADEALGA